MNENGQGDVLPKITLEDLRRISQESQTFDEYVDKIHKLCPGHGDVRPKPKTPTWAEILEQLNDLEKRLNELRTPPLIPEQRANEITDEELVQLWRECDCDPLKFAYKFREAAA